MTGYLLRTDQLLQADTVGILVMHRSTSEGLNKAEGHLASSDSSPLTLSPSLVCSSDGEISCVR